MGYLRTYGPAADPIATLGWGLLTISVLTCLIIAGLLLGAIFGSLPPESGAGHPKVVRRGSGLPWIYWGVGISSVFLILSAVWMLVVVSAVARPEREPDVAIQVVGHQWWWEARYLSPTGEVAFVTANELQIPAGRPVRLDLLSADVIHSFWIPKLAGKTDLIPGLVNIKWIEASVPGVYRGQCAEYCGQQHAHMNLWLVAQPPDAFEAWWRAQSEPARPPVTALAETGYGLFMQYCSGCHTVRGTPASGELGPELTHLMSRRTIATGTLENVTGHLAGWIANAPSIKPGVRMPAMAPGLSGPQLRAVLAYVQTLH